ncbi:MAG: M1 family metallopeptidase [Ginsengibacter sp.]
MKKLFVLLFIFSQITAPAQTEKNYFQQKVDYKIDVVLNETTKTLDGFIEMSYQNNSPDTINFIWFHLWPNAFKNDRTAFSEQLLQNGRTDFYFSIDEKRGFINKLDFKVNDIPAVLDDHPLYIDVAKLRLPEPLFPGETIKITTPFHVKIPFNFSRGGYTGNTFQITQWYPKPAVYDRKGWHPMPYLDQGEFYSEFGDFDVKITVPEKLVIAATGDLVSVVDDSVLVTDQMPHDKNIGKSENGGWQISIRDKKNVQKERKETSKTNNPLIGRKSNQKSINLLESSSFGSLKTYHYKQENVHDFAWFADKEFILKQDTLLLSSGRIIDVFAYYSPSGKEVWKNSISFLKDAIKTRSNWLGEYPYSTVKAVETKMAFAGGMEYPTITNISPVENEKSLDMVIEHEVGHNWNYGILATNERDHPWMDEGINTYYDNRYQALKYPANSIDQKKGFFSKRIPADPTDLGYRILTANKNDQPIETRSADLSDMNYVLIAYYKSGLWIERLEKYLGKNVLDRAMHEYYNRWKFKHPNPSDFKKVMEDVSGKNMDSIFSLLNKKGTITPTLKKQLKLTSFFSFDKTEKYHYIFLSPAVGINYYDKIMLGGLMHNYTLPEPNFHFFVAPMYATGSKTVNGIGRVGYNIMSYGVIRKTEILLSASKFTMDSFVDSIGRTSYMEFNKLVPGIKLTFRNKDAKSKVIKFLQWKTYFIEETGLLFSRDTIEQKDIITYPKTNRYLNQLTFSLENNRVLYPYSGKLIAEQGSGFVRIAFDGNYFFNYSKGGGMDLRIFAGKFIYLVDKTITNQYQYRRYQLNMTGPNGYEDYTYSNYFIGRNEFDKVQSQQIMIRDGGFKVRTDLLNSKIGKSDDWLAALNFKTDFPKAFNPLQVLPFEIPLKVFFDVGTYSEAWKKDAATEKFIFDAGLQLSICKDLVNIYIPIFYSKVYSQYFKSTIPKDKRFWQNISFSIDIQKFKLNRFLSIPEL